MTRSDGNDSLGTQNNVCDGFFLYLLFLYFLLYQINGGHRESLWMFKSSG